MLRKLFRFLWEPLVVSLRSLRRNRFRPSTSRQPKLAKADARRPEQYAEPDIYSEPSQDPLYNPHPRPFRRRRRRRSWLVRLLRGTVALAISGLILTLALVLPWGYLPLPTTSFMLQNVWVNRGPYRYRWTPYRKIAPEMALAVMAAEDQRFPTHNGFDFEEIIARAIEVRTP